jgi:hypothetical protein
MAQSFRNRAALSGYIAREVKRFFAPPRKKLRVLLTPIHRFSSQGYAGPGPFEHAAIIAQGFY